MITLTSTKNHDIITIEDAPGLKQYLEKLLLHRAVPSPFEGAFLRIDSKFDADGDVEFKIKDDYGYLSVDEIAMLIEKLPGEQLVDFKRLGTMVKVGNKVYCGSGIFDKEDAAAMLGLFE